MKLVIFDCDGTLVDSQHLIVAAMNQAFRWNGLVELPRVEVLSIVGLSLSFAIETLLPNQPKSVIDGVSDGYREAYGRLRRDPTHHEPLYPGILELIEALSMNDEVVLGVATGKSIRGVDALFERMNLTHHFHTIQTADTHPSKPDPSMILKAMSDAGTQPEATVMIGDTSFDIEMARQAGVLPIGVSWGYHSYRVLEEAGAAHIVDDATELQARIASHFSHHNPALLPFTTTKSQP